MEDSVKIAIQEIARVKPNLAKKATDFLVSENLLTEEKINSCIPGKESLARKIDKIMANEEYAMFS